jgi:hypothetical protein
MELKEFRIGLEFYTHGDGTTPRKWRCTDVGTRTIAAIELKPGADPRDHNGPPYSIVEVLWDEYDQGGCVLDPSEL